MGARYLENFLLLSMGVKMMNLSSTNDTFSLLLLSYDKSSLSENTFNTSRLRDRENYTLQ